MQEKIPYNSYIVRYSEIALKGDNRIYFERQLINNIRKQVLKNQVNKIYNPRGRIIVETKNELDLKRVMGISSYSRSIKLDLDYEKLKKKCSYFVEKLKQDKKLKSFRIRCQRNNKKFPLTSVDIEKDIGNLFRENSAKKVDLKNPDYVLTIELVSNYFLVTDEKQLGYNGLPIGVQGKLFAYVYDKPSLLAAWIFMKRGSEIILVTKKDIDVSLLEKYNPTNFQKVKVKKISELDSLAKDYKVKGIITGYTIENMKKLDTELVQLDPLIVWSKEQIKETLKEISK
jgi:thiamine biosynthesis protein ThiI